MNKEHNQLETANANDGDACYLIADDSYVFVNSDGTWGDKDNALTISCPAVALRKAVEIRQLHSDRLENGDLYIYRFMDGEIDPKPVLRMGDLKNGSNRVALAHQWKNHISMDVPFPEIFGSERMIRKESL